MSRIGKQPITVPAGVDVTLQGNVVHVKGPKGKLEFTAHPTLGITVVGNVVTLKRKGAADKMAKSVHGLARAVIQNMVTGVSKGFDKKLEIIGVGYRAQTSGKKITLALGYSHPIEYTAPEGITIEMDKEKKNIITVSGIDRQVVGEVAANLRSYRPPEPYKGKGIRYVDEFVPRKAGKTAGKE